MIVSLLFNDNISISIQLKIGFHGEYTIDSQLCKFLITLNTNKKRERERDTERELRFLLENFLLYCENVPFTVFDELTGRRVD